ncbi:hypothetical protein RG47T_4983 [Mucilaginibacter polytrichastri]|uniref:DinB-like domain-containing protein n=1 Tax=Mucilaginibacter polytrichastri TaxID=1302689 RepID=A0A1Q6A672_9SPHI|nr:hypothetical protein RG47T_4983 [Mucilaginibacter polytrichastri]
MLIIADTPGKVKINQQRKRIEEALDKYRSWLDDITDSRFGETPPIGGWSYAEVYSHILQSDFSSLIAAEKCARKTGVLTAKGTNLFGRFVLLTGILPRAKMPEMYVSASKKISKEEARNLLIRVRSRLDSVMEVLRNAPQDYKIKHPRLGMLNAEQWLKFTRIHTEHHLKQLERIKKSFDENVPSQPVQEVKEF